MKIDNQNSFILYNRGTIREELRLLKFILELFRNIFLQKLISDFC